MQILCITSLIYRTTNNLQNWQRYVDSKWAFSEIQIGKRRGDAERIYYFVLFRNQQKVFDAKMTKGSMKVVDWIAATLIEIETAAEEQFRISSSGAYIERIKIRCIKVPKTAHFIESIKAGLIEHAANLEKHMQNVTLNATTNINEFLKDCEAVIKKGGIPQIENEGGEKARRNRYSEINCAIKDLCDENSGSPDNVKSGSKHDTYIEKSVMTIIPRKRALPSGRNYDVRTEFQTARNVYSSCKELKFYKVNLPSVNPRWFDSQSLRVLDFNRISVFQTPNAWSIFINNIVRLPNLYRLNFINCSLETIPDDLFVKLPPTLFTLNLEGNNLQEISAQIKKLKNLMYLDVSNNPKLKSQGIPWEFFPRSLEDIQFYGTSIRATPQSVRESIKLHILKDDVFGREDIDFEDEFGFEDYAEVDLNAENLDLSHLHMKKFNDAKLKQNIKTLDLGHTGLEIFTFSRNFEFLTDLLLNNNQLKTIPWESLPTNLNTIDFSNNYLSEIGSIKHLINLSWFDLSNNNIDTIKDNEFNQLTQFIDINLSNNSLSMLPKNFEKIQSTFLTLNLRHNKFSYKEQNLCVDLWDHLPEVRTLYLCQNRLGILPCDFSLQLENIAEIIATDCDIHYICPRLYSNITKLNVLKNPISALSFIPRFFLPVPQPKEEVEIPFTDEIDEKILLIDLSVVDSNIADYKKWDEWQKNMFQKVDDDERETELQCNCCASCGRQDTTKFEQKMVMDALLILAEEVEKDGSICHYKNKGYFARPSGTWAANVQTKLCDTCMVEFKDDRKVAAPPALKTISTLDLNLSDSESVDEEERDLSSCPLCYPSKTILPLPPLQSSIRQQQRFYREIKIPYNPPSKSWLRKTCKRLKLPLCCYVFKNAISSNNITHCEPTLTASVWGDGHSGYQSLSYLITGRLFNYHLFRILISDTILQNSDKNFENLDGFKNAKRKTEMKKNADYFVNSVEEWMNEIDLAAAAYLLQCNIAIWERNGYWSLYNSLTFEKGFSIQHDAIVDQPTILLNNSFCEHNFFNPVINVGQRAERIEDRDVVMEEQQNLDIAEDMDIVENTNDVAELTKNMRELSLLFTEHPGNTDTLDLSSLSIDGGDGHSGYQSLSYLITGRLFNYHLFRILISDTILQNSDKNFENLDGFKNAKRKTEMKKNADYFVNSVEEWMNEIDLAAAAYLLQCNIAIWERNGYWSLYNSLTFEKGFSIQHDAIVDQPTILLNNSFCEHNFFNPVINVGQRAERIEDRDVVMEEQQNLDIAEDMDIVENTNDVAELTKNMRELSLLFTEHPGNTDTLDLSSLSIDEFDDMDIPLEIKTLNVSRNKIKSMRFEKHFEFLRRLNLDKNQITNISWQTLPALLEYISLDNNYLTTIESIPLKFLKQLNINNNDLLKISWKMLPSSLEDIFFNGNHLTSIETVQHLKNLRRLSVTRNKITKITSDFNQLKNLVEIDLNYNCLISLPKGFELIHTSAEDGLTLCLAGNKFDYDKQNLNEDLWTKLPMIKTLNIWENKIDSLPCQLADRLEANSTIVASDCDIRHVCPKIYSKFKKLNLYNNELDALTFIPKTILQPPISQRKITVEYSSDLKVLDMHASIAKPPASLPKLFKKPEYTFNTITKKKNILNQVQCKCCAECNSSSRDTLMVQQMMVMDFNLRVNSKYEEVGDDYDTRETIYSSGGWVSKIQTRLCDPCKSEILLKVEESYQSFINDENAEIVKPKQSRIEKNFEASLQAPHEPMVATAELTAENTSLLPQLQQPSTSHYLPSIKTLYSHKNGFEDDHFAVYQDPVCDMTNTENAGYINDLPQKIILLNEGGIQVAEFDHSNDPSMLQQDAIRADQSKNQPLNDMQLDVTIHETNKEMDITDEYIVDLVLDMMEDHKVADNQNLDLNECEIVFENLQPKTILEANKNDERVEEDGRQFYEYPIEGFNNNVILQARHYNFIMPEIYDLQISIPPMIEDLQRYLNLLELPSQLAANSPLLNFASVTTAGKNMITVSTLADGNCGYRAISILLTGVEDYFWKIRIKIYDHIVVNGHRIWGIGSQEQKIKFYKKLERILKMKKPTAVDLEFWCKNEDLYALADLFECNVYTYSPNPLSNYPNITGHYKNGEKIPHSPTLFLMWINNNHFEPILGFV